MKHAHHDANHPDRSIDLQEELDTEIGETIAEANEAGYGTEETVEALEEVIENTKVARDLNPDPQTIQNE